MAEDSLFEDAFKSLIIEVSKIEIVYDYVVRYYKEESYTTYEIKKINGEYPYLFIRKIQRLGKEGLFKLNEEISKIEYESRVDFLEEVKYELLSLKSKVKGNKIVYDESEWGPREVSEFKSFVNAKLIPFNNDRAKGHDKSILKQASEFAEDYLVTIANIAIKIDFLINQIELLPESKEMIKDKNTIKVFYSWQSDRIDSKKLIQKALNELKKKFKEKEKNIVIESDSRRVPGSQDIPNTLFKKIRESDIFVADVNFIGTNTHKDQNIDLRQIPNPNVMIELGYAAGVLGWDRIILVLDIRINRIEELPFDIRQRTICWYDSTFPDKLNEKLKLSVEIMTEK